MAVTLRLAQVVQAAVRVIPEVVGQTPVVRVQWVKDLLAALAQITEVAGLAAVAAVVVVVLLV